MGITSYIETYLIALPFIGIAFRILRFIYDVVFPIIMAVVAAYYLARILLSIIGRTYRFFKRVFSKPVKETPDPAIEQGCLASSYTITYHLGNLKKL